ncbi:McrB family protein [Mucilaginibacter sp. 3215]|uniref:McrB family protein n=1 Tax=Mucilaginibacter sp. 3215 TaxID=3373912 RepID=UPI003D1FA945
MIPDYINESHVLQALTQIDRDGILDPRAQSRVHILNYKGNSYPPKYVVAIAQEIATGNKPNSRDYNTTEAQEFLKKLSPEFTIQSKQLSPQQELIERYKVYLSENKLKDELYKWELVQKYQGRPDPDGENFSSDITNIDYSNLIFYDAVSIRDHLAEEFPELYQSAFRVLFDERILLQDRIDKFQEIVNDAYHRLEPTFSHRHDERTIATFLTYYRPDLYSFYKNSFYKKYCRKLQIKAAPAGKKYPHYLELSKSFIRDYIETDEELLDQFKGCLSDSAYPDPNHTILAQGILYRMLDKRYESFTGIIEDLTESLAEDTDSVRAYHPGRQEDNGLDGAKQTYAWLVSDGDILNSLEAHFEVSVRKIKKAMVYVDIHFEGKRKKVFSKLISQLPAQCEWIDWQHGKSIRYKGGINIDDEELIEKIKTQLYYLDANLGDHIRNIMTNEIKPTQPTTAVAATDLNQILFGPPGTGKTYNTIDRALKIIGEQKETELDWTDRDAVTRLFRERVDEGRIVFTTFHQSMSYEDFIEGLKPETTDENKVVYHVRDGVFKTLCLQAERPKVKTDNFDAIYKQLLNDIDQSEGQKLVLETLVHSKEFTIYKNSKDNIRFHANTEKAYEGVIRKDYLKEYLMTGKTLDWPSYTRAVGEYMKAKFDYDQQTDHIAQNYVLIIDEINRGNVSQIFGELITLIESDKRSGNKEALSVTLPYSQSKFSVPPNVFLIGTMNTADRSVEALDTALRRRFVFHEMPPLPELVTKKVDDIDLGELLKIINQRISILLDRDHLIGHSFFINVNSVDDLRIAIQNKVIPLLQEYFYGDYGKIGLVMGEGFVQLKTKYGNKAFANFKNYDSSIFDESQQYQLVDYSAKAVHTLIIDDAEVQVDLKQAIHYLLGTH